MKIGVLFCAYRNINTVENSLKGWLDIKESGYDVEIAAVSLPFAQFEPKEDDGTQRFLSASKDKLAWLRFGNATVGEECNTRDLAAQVLKERGCDVIILWDGDEIATKQQLEAVLRFIAADKFCAWFQFSYKNYVFDESHFLAEPFTPPRAFRVKVGSLKLGSLIADNLFYYEDTHGQRVSPWQASFRTIPKKTAWIKHLSWLDDSRAREKIAYQQLHIPEGCPFLINKDGEMKWNEPYFLTRGENIPIVIQEDK